jgi:hypothetical protein
MIDVGIGDPLAKQLINTILHEQRSKISNHRCVDLYLRHFEMSKVVKRKY